MQKRTIPFLLSMLLILFGIGCSSANSVYLFNDGDATEPDGDTDSFDPDGDTEILDGDDDTLVDGDEESDEDWECRYAKECSDTQDCVDHKCVRASICRKKQDCDDDHVCWKVFMTDDTGVCRLYCATDMDCDADSHCNAGLCDEYVPIAPGPEVTPHPDWDNKLHASFAVGPMKTPMGTTMLGYGNRSGPNGPYQKAMGASTGTYDRLNIKVLTLDDGSNRAVFIRLPMCFATDYMVNKVVARVIALGGPDLRDNLVFTATHTHSGPGRYWNLLTHLNFGGLGFGEFSYEILTRITNSIADVILEAQKEENFKEVRFGYALNENFDPEDLINRDRRSENDQFKDNRLMVWRIDEKDGSNWKPWFIGLMYATHGTIEGNRDSFMTNDAAGGAETITQLLYEKSNPGTKINTMFFQGMAGDVAPAGGLHTKHTQNQILIGTRVHAKVMELFEKLGAGGNGREDDQYFVSPMTDTINLKVLSKRVPIDRKSIGYADDEFYSDPYSLPQTTIEFGDGPFKFGAFQCGLFATLLEENLDLHAYSEDGTLLKKSIEDKTGNDGEQVIITADQDGTYYIKVDGYNGCMAGYKLLVEYNNKAGQKNIPDRKSPLPRPQFKSQMVPSACDEDSFDTAGNNNDDMANAVEVTIGVTSEQLQVCPYNEDWFKITLSKDETVNIKLIWNQDDDAYNEHTHLEDGHLGCGMPIEEINYGPIPQFSKTRFTSVLISGEDMGGGLYLAGLPGESSSRMGHSAIESLMQETDFENVIIFGYNNDHHFYINTEDDWLQSGYSPGMSMWGFRFGEFCINHLKEMAIAISNKSGQELEDFLNEFPKVKPLYFDDLTDDTRVPLKTNVAEIGIFAENVKTYQPADTKRMQEQAKMRWLGGDPGVDFPNIYLEKQDPSDPDADSSGWVQVKRKEGSGRIYSDDYYEMSLEFENEHFELPNKIDPDYGNYWILTWEETYDFPAGSYRFRIEGNYYNGPEDSFDYTTGIEDYTIYSDAFELLPADIEVQQFTVAGTTLSGSLRYAHPTSTDDGTSEFSGADSTSLLLHSTEVDSHIGARVIEDDIASISITITEFTSKVEPVVIEAATYEETTGTINYINARSAEGVETVASTNDKITTFTATIPTLVPGTYTATINIVDDYGNKTDLTKEFDFTVNN